MAVDKDGNVIDESGATSVTDDGNAGVSGRSESEIEAGAEGAGESKADESGEGDEILDALAEADPKRAVVGLKKRLAKLTDQRNRARAEAQERKALETQLEAYKKRDRDAEAARRAADRATPEAQKAEERRQAIREAIDDTYGPGTSLILESQHEEQQRQKEAYGQNAIGFLKSELEDHGINVTTDTLIRWERAIGSEIQEDPELWARYRRPATLKDAIKDAVERVRDGLANPILKQRGAKPLERITRNREAVLGGGPNRGTVAEVEEPVFDKQPPKDLKGRDLEDWWARERDAYRARLLAADRQA